VVDETEVEIKDKAGTMKILESLGLEIECVVDRERRKYEKGNVVVVFDKIGGLGSFVEVEVVGEPSEENKSLVMDTARELGLSEDDRVAGKGYPDLLREIGFKG